MTRIDDKTLDMGKLKESVQGIREAIKRQETHLTIDKNGGLKNVSYSLNRDFNEGQWKSFNILNEAAFKPLLHGTGSDISQTSHWSCSLESMCSSIDDLKQQLKNQDKQAVEIVTENEQLKHDLKKMEKELKKQKFLLKAERETFEQYKRDICKEVKNYKSEESQDEIPNKTKTEILKLKSELNHFKKLYLESEQSVRRLTKQLTILKEDQVMLKGFICQQENKFNKFIFESSQRFEISRKDMKAAVEKLQAANVPAEKYIDFKLAERNSCLVVDNCYLKADLDRLKLKLERKEMESRLQRYNNQVLRNKLPKCANMSKSDSTTNRTISRFNFLKFSASEKSSLAVGSKKSTHNLTKSSYSNFVKKNISPRQIEAKKTSSKLNLEALNLEGTDIIRTWSAPLLNRCSLDHL